MIFSVVLLLLTLYLWSKFMRKSTRDAESALPLPPGCLGWPIIGETIPFLMNGRTYFRNRLNKYGSIFRTHLIGTPTIVICGTEYITQMFNNENAKLSGYTPSGKKFFGEGALCCTRSLDDYRKKQKLIQTVFKHKVLENITISAQQMMYSTISKWVKKENILGVEEIQRLILTLSCNCLLGIDLKQETREQFIRAFNIYKDNFFSLQVNLPGTSFYKAMKAKKEVENIISDYLDCQNLAEYSVMNILLSHNDNQENPMSKHELINLAIELLFGGYTTTASACCTLTIHLALNKEALLELRKEIVSKLNAEEDCASFSDITNLEYLQDVVKEVLRICPPIAGAFRKTTKTFEVGGYQIPKGWSVLYCIQDTHERTEPFINNDPFTFKPQRWKDLKNRNRFESRVIHDKASALSRSVSKFEYLPFGVGYKKCPGREYALLLLKIFAIAMCKSCDWSLDNGDQVPTINTNPIPFPNDGMPITLRKIM